MQVKQFEKCCCTDLRTGTIIIGVLGLIGGLYSGISVAFGGDSGSAQHDGSGGEGTTTRVVSAIVGIIVFILNIVLIMGAVKRNHKMIYPWLIVTVICAIVYIIRTIIVGIFLCLGGHIGAGITVLIALIVFALIEIYCILIVNSYYTNLKNGEPVATHPA